jgi:hypothetical protein
VRQWVKPGETVSVILVSVALSGLSRRVRLLVTAKGQTREISRAASIILGWHYDGDSVRVDGCGTDAAFQIVYELSRCLYPKGYKVPKGQYRNNADSKGWDLSGGYALKNRWL